MSAISFPPYEPQPLHVCHQDCDHGVFDVCFDADLRYGREIAHTSIEFLQRHPETLTDDSQQRNRAWCAWWDAVRQAENRLPSYRAWPLVRQFAPAEHRHHPAHARHIRACTTRLLKALRRESKAAIRTPAGMCAPRTP